MDSIGKAWLLNKSGNCIEVYAHPSESFEFNSIVDIVSVYGSELDKINCEDWKSKQSEELKNAILRSYNRDWCKVRLWSDNKLTFRVTLSGFDWYKTIVDFLRTYKYFNSASIYVSDISGRVLWDGLSYGYCIDSANEEKLRYALVK